MINSIYKSNYFTMKIQFAYENLFFFVIEETVILRTFGYQKYKRNFHITISMINYETFETRSTTNDHYLYYSDTKYLKLDMKMLTRRITSSPIISSSVPLFQHIKYLVIYYYPVIYVSWSNNSLNIGKKNTYSFDYSSRRFYSLSFLF